MTDPIMHTYGRLPVAFAKGEGCWLWDEDGQRYFDAISGVAVCNLGHAHPAVAKAVAEQAATLVHTSNLYRIPLQEQLAAELVRLAGMDRAFFCNSGAEANEAAIKLARLHGHRNGIHQPTIVVAQGAFHGRTMATLTATGNARVQQGFEPLVQGFIRVPYNDLETLERIAAADPNVVAVLVEPVQGEGGVRVPEPGYLGALRQLCNQMGWLMMVDEVQTGIGRTGRWFACQHEGVVPDVMTLAKGLGNGFPIGACLASGIAADVFTPGNHATTFGGSPLACSAALAVLRTIEHDQLTERAAHLGSRLLEGLVDRLGQTAGVETVRGHGLMVGIVLDRPCGELVGRALKRGLLLNVTAERVVRLLPPLVMSDAEADFLADQVASLLHDFLTEKEAA